MIESFYVFFLSFCAILSFQVHPSGQRIREARIKLHWSQKALAVRLKLEGVELERDSISRIEIGTRFVADYEIKMLAKVLNTSVTWLLGIE